MKYEKMEIKKVVKDFFVYKNNNFLKSTKYDGFKYIVGTENK